MGWVVPLIDARPVTRWQIVRVKYVLHRDWYPPQDAARIGRYRLNAPFFLGNLLPIQMFPRANLGFARFDPCPNFVEDVARRFSPGAIFARKLRG